ncbi:MAG: helix-turn-helix domain-containing protein [Firmicutes bacterium]|nr:helix-turn-helix domain-containing protein [Bacillota bacterium]
MATPGVHTLAAVIHDPGPDALPSLGTALAALADCRIGVGLSPAVEDAAGLAAARHQAAYAARLAAHPALPVPVLPADAAPGLAPVGLLQGDPARAAEAARRLAPLTASDTRHGTRLLDTLKAYLLHDRRLDETSRALYIHPGTLKYCLRLIRRLTGWDPATTLGLFDMLFSLFLSEDPDLVLRACYGGRADPAGAVFSGIFLPHRT